jgi:hypothetical protein
MPGGAYTVYASDIGESMVGAVQSFTSAQYNTLAAGSTTYMPVSAPLGMNLGGILIYANIVVTPNAATAIVAGSDVLDQCLLGYEVTNQVGGGVRCKTLSRKGSEEAERLFLAPPTSSAFVYPRASATSFTATTTAVTYNAFFFIPSAGGQAANVKVYWPGAANTYSTPASISSILTTYYAYAVPSLAPAVTSFQETLSRVVGAGQNDIQGDIPAGMSPDYFEVIGATWGVGATNISKVTIDAQGGAGRAVDFEDIYSGNAAQTLFPQSQAANQNNVLVGMHRQRADHLWVTTGAGWSGAIDELWCELDFGSPLTPEPTPAATPVPPLTQDVASTTPAGAVVPKKVAGGILARSPPRRVA